MTPWLRSLTALAEDPHPQSGSPPSITPVSGNPMHIYASKNTYTHRKVPRQVDLDVLQLTL